MTFIEEVILENQELWDTHLNQSFLQDIRNHCLQEEKFIHYLKEDTKYLKDYARVFGLGIYKSKHMNEITTFYEMLAFVESSETAMRVRTLQRHGYDMTCIEEEPQHPITKDYTSFLLETAQHGSVADILFAMLPCLLSYAYIGKKLLEENPNIIKESPYGDWIEEYVGEGYITKCKEWSLYANSYTTNMSEEEKQHVKALFKEASIHEQYFWEMSYQTKGKV